MFNPQRSARRILLLAFLLIITCFAQRVIHLRTLPLTLSPSVAFSQPFSMTEKVTKRSALAGICSFSSKSLSGTQPIMAESPLLFLLLLIVSALFPVRRWLRSPSCHPCFFPPPHRRRHLELCNLRE